MLPSAFTWIVASLHVSFGFALIGAIVGEFLGAQQGLGLLIKQAQGTFNANGVWAAMVIMARRRAARRMAHHPAREPPPPLAPAAAQPDPTSERSHAPPSAHSHRTTHAHEGDPMSTIELLALRRSAVAAALAVTGCSSTASTTAATAASRNVGAASGHQGSIMVGGLNKQIYLPFMLAEQLGYYKEQGLNVALSDEPAGVDATTNMLAGKVDGVGGFYDHTIDLQGSGSRPSPWSRCCSHARRGRAVPQRPRRARSSRPADWKGRNLGITDLGSSTDFLTQYLAQQERCRPHDDPPRRCPVPAPTLIGAMAAQERSTARMTTEPTVSQLLATSRPTSCSTCAPRPAPRRRSAASTRRRRCT